MNHGSLATLFAFANPRCVRSKPQAWCRPPSRPSGATRPTNEGLWNREHGRCALPCRTSPRNRTNSEKTAIWVHVKLGPPPRKWSSVFLMVSIDTNLKRGQQPSQTAPLCNIDLQDPFGSLFHWLWCLHTNSKQRNPHVGVKTGVRTSEGSLSFAFSASQLKNTMPVVVL